MGQFEIAGEVFSIHSLLVGDGLFDRLGRLAGDASENVKVSVAKTVAKITGINLDYTEQPAVSVGDRHRHHRPDASHHDAGIGLKS
jgi:hypothetical protein